MKMSRNYVKAILVEEKKENTKLFKSITEVAHKYSKGPQHASDVDFSQFNDSELTSLSRMKFKSNGSLATMAKRALEMRKNSPVKPEKLNQRGATKVGPEAW